jgi:hypothetical protein
VSLEERRKIADDVTRKRTDSDDRPHRESDVTIAVAHGHVSRDLAVVGIEEEAIEREHRRRTPSNDRHPGDRCSRSREPRKREGSHRLRNDGDRNRAPTGSDADDQRGGPFVHRSAVDRAEEPPQLAYAILSSLHPLRRWFCFDLGGNPWWRTIAITRKGDRLTVATGDTTDVGDLRHPTRPNG